MLDPDPDFDVWLSAAMRGEAEATDHIVRAYGPSVYRYWRSRLWDRETAEHVTQEVMIAVVQALPHHRAEDHALGAFVRGIASRQVAMAYRSRACRPELADVESPDVVDDASG